MHPSRNDSVPADTSSRSSPSVSVPHWGGFFRYRGLPLTLCRLCATNLIPRTHGRPLWLGEATSRVSFVEHRLFSSPPNFPRSGNVLACAIQPLPVWFSRELTFFTPAAAPQSHDGLPKHMHLLSLSLHFTGPAVVQDVERLIHLSEDRHSIPGSFSPHVGVSSGKILNPEFWVPINIQGLGAGDVDRGQVIWRQAEGGKVQGQSRERRFICAACRFVATHRETNAYGKLQESPM
ncbi:hypothetical protein NQZ68_005467 [Dissostichus eleginoides]|nr:hypothetical protein NQZ68_005467 [Dissostichus eleginoides]